MTRKIEINVFDGLYQSRATESIEADYISAEEIRRRRADLGIVYSRPDFWALGEDLIVYLDRSSGRYLYTLRPGFGERRAPRT